MHGNVLKFYKSRSGSPENYDIPDYVWKKQKRDKQNLKETRDHGDLEV